MADDHTQRPYRSSDSIARAAPARPGASPGNDPLAELARLIGQGDPFSEYGRNQQIAPPAHQPAQVGAGSANAPDYYAAPTAPTLPPMREPPPSFARQPFGGPPLASNAEAYQGDHSYPAAAQDGGYQDDDYHPDQAHPDGAHGDYYEDAPPSRRRTGIMVIAGVFALAVIGSAGAFGYRALFGTSGTSGPPPVIKADTAPSKIVPASTRDASNKAINDRVGDRTQAENLVSREEQPVDIKDRQAPFPPDQSNNPMPAQGSGVVSPDAKRVRTIVIRPDQATIADASPNAAPPAPAAVQQPRAATVAPPRQVTPPAPPPQQAPPPRVVASAPPVQQEAEPVRSPAPMRSAIPSAVAQHQASANAPLSLSPDASSPGPARVAPRPAAPARTASAPPQAAPAAAPAGGGGYAVQVSSQRSEAEAQAAFRSLQSKYPDQLGGKQPVIRKVELGDKGTYYRALVPSATGNEASQLCSNLKAAGGSCIIQRN